MRRYLYLICWYYIVIGVVAVAMASLTVLSSFPLFKESFINDLFQPFVWLAYFLVGWGGMQFGAVPWGIQNLVPEDQEWGNTAIFGLIGIMAIVFSIWGLRSLKDKFTPKKSFFLWFSLFILSVLFLFIPPEAIRLGFSQKLFLAFPLLRFLHPTLMGCATILFYLKSRAVPIREIQKTG